MRQAQATQAVDSNDNPATVPKHSPPDFFLILRKSESRPFPALYRYPNIYFGHIFCGWWRISTVEIVKKCRVCLKMPVVAQKGPRGRLDETNIPQFWPHLFGGFGVLNGEN